MESIGDINISKYICDESICELFAYRELFAEHCSELTATPHSHNTTLPLTLYFTVMTSYYNAIKYNSNF